MTLAARAAAAKDSQIGSALEVLLIFAKLGVTCFGGPIAHIGYFREEFVARRRWLDEPTYADLVALCQFLPGPASSQVGFSLGLLRAGYLAVSRHGLALRYHPQSLSCSSRMARARSAARSASGCFTASSSSPLRSSASRLGHGAHAVPGSRTGFHRRLSQYCSSCSAPLAAQIAAIVLGAIAGLWLCRVRGARVGQTYCRDVSRTRRIRGARQPSFVLLAGLPVFASLDSTPIAVRALYRSDALVLSRSVALPLLREAFVTPGWVNDDTFLAGYGAAQAVPGPLFTFAAYLGVVVGPSPHGLASAALGLIAIFLPGALILMGTLPFWESFPAAAERAGNDAECQRCGGRPARRGALQSGLDEFGQDTGGLRARACRVRPTDCLARTAAGCCRHLRARWHHSRLQLNFLPRMRCICLPIAIVLRTISRMKAESVSTPSDLGPMHEPATNFIDSLQFKNLERDLA